MTPADARELLDALAEETDRLRDPAGLQFAGGTSEATARAREALAAQLADVPATRSLLTAALPGAATDGVVDDYEAAVADALDRVRRGAAPEQDRVTRAPTPAPVTRAPGEQAPVTRAPGEQAPAPEPAGRRPPAALVVPVVLVVAVVLVLAVLVLAG
ncbi:hypothetical protein [Rhodococcus aerolatus]